MDEPGEPGAQGAQDVPVDFDAYVALRWTRLVRAAVLLGAGREEAEDVVQSCLVRCLVRWDRVRAADDVDAYVHKALVNTFVSSRRRRWHGERPTDHLPEVAHTDAADEVDDRDAVLRALEKLGTDQRTVVVLRYYSHLTERQTAEALGVAPGTVKSRLSRALRVLAADPSLLALRGAG